ncbi:hypothetical protein H0H93_001440, partial [Arthromyces matolae]
MYSLIGPFEANTSFPILVVGNTADPVTPLWAAKKTAKGFPSAVVLTQDSPGHCSLAAPSVCTQIHIRNYFINGRLPPPNTICPVIGRPFPTPAYDFGSSSASKSDRQVVLDKNSIPAEEALSPEERLIYEAARKLSLLQ